MVRKFFQQKFEKAKKAADKELFAFIEEVEREVQQREVQETGERTASELKSSDKVLEKLLDCAKAIKNATTESLQAGKLRNCVRTAWECMWRTMKAEDLNEGKVIECKENAENPLKIKVLSTKLLWILSKLKYRSECLVSGESYLRGCT